MNTQINPLQPGDLIYICAPAKSIEKEHVYFAQALFEAKGYRVEISKHCLNTYHYFSGTDVERAADLQYAFDNPEIKAIVCARGGYGSIRIIDHLGWASMLLSPKWLIGFSDITIFHQRMLRHGLESIHGTMPLNFQTNSNESFTTLFDALEGRAYSIQSPASNFNKMGECRGKLVGGNLSILYSLLATDERIDYTGTILFIEDLSEQLYHLDRMFYSFKKAGILEQINGLVIGGMTDLKDTVIPFGQNYQELILSHLTFRKIPVCFDFPAGHIDDNRALILGQECSLKVSNSGAELNFNSISHV